MAKQTRHAWNRLSSRLDSFASRTSLAVRVWTDCGPWGLIGQRLRSAYTSHQTWEVSGSPYGTIRTVTDGWLLAVSPELVATLPEQDGCSFGDTKLWVGEVPGTQLEDGLIWLGPFGDAGKLWTGWERVPACLSRLVGLAGFQLYVKDEKLVSWCKVCGGPVRALSGAHHRDGCSATPVDETHVSLSDPDEPVDSD